MNASPDPKSIADFILVIGFLTSLAVNILTAFKLMRNDSQRREGTLRTRFTSVEEMAELRSQVETLCSQLRQDRDELLRVGEQRARDIHQRIDAINEEMPWKIIELLRNTGALP